MSVRVLLFASARDKVGRAAIEIPAAAAATVGALLALPELAALDAAADRLRFAINEEFAALDAPLADGDEVAVIPPVCGG